MPSRPRGDDALAAFQAPVREWFANTLGAPTRAQQLGWPAIARGESTLLVAPTGSGKTLAAFLFALDRLLFAPPPEKAQRCRVLYVSPLKALAVDVEKNLRVPLAGILAAARRLGVEAHEPAVAVRTGDTPARERRTFATSPADILITTPESLYLVLTSAARVALSSVTTVIVDEIHTMVASKRGAHLALSLERLEELAAAPLQRIGLSATMRPLDEGRRFLGGFETRAEGTAPQPRPVTVADSGTVKTLDLTIAVPVEDLARLAAPTPAGGVVGPVGGAQGNIWSAVHPMLVDLIRTHTSTLLFVNSRRLAERLAAALNEIAGEDLVKAHHGSIAAPQRALLEDELKRGVLKAMVATSSLELGIDMGAIDLVIQVEAPTSVASALQRIGRAGHHVDAVAKGVIVPKYRGDLLAAAALVTSMRAGTVEAIRYPRNPLDVLAQQVAAAVAMEPWGDEALLALVRRAAPFADLGRPLFDSVLDMLSGRWPSDEFAELKPRLVWDRVKGTLRAREGTRALAVTSGGTIPDRGLFGVFLTGAERGRGRVGELDEEMVFEARVGETFLLGASTWRIDAITHDRVLVTPAPGEPGKMPFWRGERPGRPLEFGRAIGALTRELSSLPAEAAERRLREHHALDERAAANLVRYIADQAASGSALPSDQTLVVERWRDEMGDLRVCILSPFGSKVHAPWALAIAARLRARHAGARGEVEVLWTDDGIVLRLDEDDEPPPADLLFPAPDELEALVVSELGGGAAHEPGRSALFATRFREAAARALLLPRRTPGRRSPLWQQRLRSARLLQAAAGWESFPIVIEAMRECLRDVFDLEAASGLLLAVARREIDVVTADVKAPSPFASALLFNYVLNFMYEGDAPAAEARAQALAIDPTRLRELLGEVALRELLDPEVVERFEFHLQHLAPECLARSADVLHELLIRIGDMTGEEAAARSSPPEAAAGWLADLTSAGQVVALSAAGETRFVAAEDAARYRDALGARLPPGLPAAFLETARDALSDLLSRFARSRGPFHAADAAQRFALDPDTVTAELGRLAASGRVTRGELRPGSAGLDWCDSGVLRALRQKSMAALRHQVEPAETAALARLYLSWQGVRSPHTRRSGAHTLREALAQLQGAAIPFSALERRVLPTRVQGYEPADLDEILASGQLLWVGDEAIGERDGRIRLVFAEQAPLLLDARAPGSGPTGAVHDRIRAHLATRGASFFPQLAGAVGGFEPEVLRALWELVWAGEVTNDTLQPLRAWAAAKPGARPHREHTDARARSVFAPRGARSIPPSAVGRWSRVVDLTAAAPSPTERLAARASQLLERHGVLVREAVQAEGVEGGFAAVYAVLKAMEEAGRVRRGYFVAGLGATQFALPQALDRLRTLRDPPGVDPAGAALVLAATDPASPWGAALAWPAVDGGETAGRPARAAGALVVLVGGIVAAWLARGAGRVLTFLEAFPERETAGAVVRAVATAVARALAGEVAEGRRRALLIETVNGRPPGETRLAPALAAAGFEPTYHGWHKRAEVLSLTPRPPAEDEEEAADEG